MRKRPELSQSLALPIQAGLNFQTKNAPTSQLRANVQRSHKLRNAHAFRSHVPLKAEKEMATHSNILASRILCTEKPGGLPSMGSHRVGHDPSNLAAAAAPPPPLKTLSHIIFTHSAQSHMPKDV